MSLRWFEGEGEVDCTFVVEEGSGLVVGVSVVGDGKADGVESCGADGSSVGSSGTACAIIGTSLFGEQGYLRRPPFVS